MIKYIYLDDSNIEIGGTNFTSLAILEDRIGEVKIIKCSELSQNKIVEHKDCIWILGNITGLYSLDVSILKGLVETVKDVVKIEFDYNYCVYRGEIPHRILGKSNCTCPSHEVVKYLYDWIVSESKYTFFMSHRQRAIYSTHFPRLRFDRCLVLSSCFTHDNFALFEKIRSNRSEDNGKWAIMEGYGGWHSQAKGFQEAANYCHMNHLNYEVLPVRNYEEHITALSNYIGLVFLPIIDDTCPRCVIEAKLIGIECVLNENCQHVYEDWFSNGIENMENYLKGRPTFFWEKIDEIR